MLISKGFFFFNCQKSNEKKTGKICCSSSCFHNYTSLPETVLFYLQKLLSVLLCIINSHKLELFDRTSGLVSFLYSLKKNTIYILKVKLNMISPQCFLGAKPLDMKSKYKATANKKKCSWYLCVVFSVANLILYSLEKEVLSWEGLKFI